MGLLLTWYGYGSMGMVVVHVLVLGLWFKC